MKTWGFAIALAFYFITPALAVQSVNVQTFNPSVSDHFVLLEDAFLSEWPKSPKYYFGMNYNYVTQPLVATDVDETSRAYTIINSIQTIDLMFGYKAASKFALYFGLPIHMVTYPDDPTPPFPSGSSTGLGDLKIMGKVRLTKDDSITGVTLIPEVRLPTGNTQNFVSDGSAYLAIRLSIEHPFRYFTLVGNLGVANAANSEYQSDSISQGIDFRNRLIAGAGAFIPFNDSVGMSVEFNSQNSLPMNTELAPNELYGGLRFAAAEGLAVTGGGSVGQLGSATGQNFRFIAGLRYTFYEAPKDQSFTPLPFTPLPLPSPTPMPYASPAPIQQPIPNLAKPLPPPAPRAIMYATRIELFSPIQFEENSARLLSESKGLLKEVAQVMKKNSRSYKKILIDGHTNKVGGDAYNLKLSLARAKAVKAYLISQGIPKAVLVARGFGQRKPKVSYQDPRAYEINRRVEFIVVK